jgi:hypothetical protein
MSSVIEMPSCSLAFWMKKLVVFNIVACDMTYFPFDFGQWLQSGSYNRTACG